MKAFHFRLLAVFALTLVLAFASVGLADDTNGKFKTALADNQTFVVTEGDQEHTYELAKDAAILIDSQLVSLSDLKANDNVTVTWELRNDRRIASMVTCNRN